MVKRMNDIRIQVCIEDGDNGEISILRWYSKSALLNPVKDVVDDTIKKKYNLLTDIKLNEYVINTEKVFLTEYQFLKLGAIKNGDGYTLNIPPNTTNLHFLQYLELKKKNHPADVFQIVKMYGIRSEILQKDREKYYPQFVKHSHESWYVKKDSPDDDDTKDSPDHDDKGSRTHIDNTYRGGNGQFLYLKNENTTMKKKEKPGFVNRKTFRKRSKT